MRIEDVVKFVNETRIGDSIIVTYKEEGEIVQRMYAVTYIEIINFPNGNYFQVGDHYEHDANLWRDLGMGTKRLIKLERR